ncbi:MAG: hypothetical protein EKK29_20250 [Hyphomicrobiales bacterium]|nr:MAG: hypothetical protein EKK29_20250 [Hyphomicrobiales bacterium]
MTEKGEKPLAQRCLVAAEKKLKGAALNTFTKKCERDAAKSICDTAANEKNLHGAARTSFTNKCVKDSIAH